MNPFEFKKKSMAVASKSGNARNSRPQNSAFTDSRTAARDRRKFAYLSQSLLSMLPKRHLMLASALSFALIIVVSLPSEQAQASRRVIEIPIPQLTEKSIAEIHIPSIDEHQQSQRNGSRLVTETVKSGDSLSRIFARAGLNDRQMFALVNSSKEAKSLAKIYPGHKLTFEVDAQQQLISLKHELNPLDSELFIYENGTYNYQRLEKSPDVKTAYRIGKIRSSLYKAGAEAGLDEELIMELAAIFGWDIDFALDIRSGDQFKLMYEEKFLDGRRIGAGNILAAEFVNQGTRFKAVRYVDENGKAQYYTPSGKAMQKAFLRAPLDFRRISSNFNPRRLHPITKTVRPHRGTDYAASRGTPVWASGDGRVIASGYSSANGNYIVIQHGNDIQTKYLHLQKRLVKKGAKVRQKQIIGKVGTTGLSTAPHLHYEFLVNGVHRNPRTIVQKLPKAKSISKAEMPRFLQQTQAVVASLDSTTQMAAISSDTQKL